MSEKVPRKKTLTFNPFDLLAKKTEMNGQKRHFFLPEKKLKIFLLIVLSSLANILHILLRVITTFSLKMGC